MEKQIKIKQQLYTGCVNYVAAKIELITKAVDELQQTSMLETKSSMGDKYETGLASIHLEIEKYAQQLNEFSSLKKILFQVNADKQYDSVQPGGIVYTNNGNYFIAINAGEFEIEGVKYLTISLASPLGKELHKRKTGDTFSFRNKQFAIELVI
ncbi:MAG: 3-oxoacyl-ACP synthase [Ignavibacteria bacterium]|nr:3-oxoacyl-ACP synthase [Ignavibacteria bacterium]